MSHHAVPLNRDQVRAIETMFAAEPVVVGVLDDLLTDISKRTVLTVPPDAGGTNTKGAIDETRKAEGRGNLSRHWQAVLTHILRMFFMYGVAPIMVRPISSESASKHSDPVMRLLRNMGAVEAATAVKGSKASVAMDDMAEHHIVHEVATVDWSDGQVVCSIVDDDPVYGWEWASRSRDSSSMLAAALGVAKRGKKEEDEQASMPPVVVLVDPERAPHARTGLLRSRAADLLTEWSRYSAAWSAMRDAELANKNPVTYLTRGVVPGTHQTMATAMLGQDLLRRRQRVHESVRDGAEPDPFHRAYPPGLAGAPTAALTHAQRIQMAEDADNMREVSEEQRRASFIDEQQVLSVWRSFARMQEELADLRWRNDQEKRPWHAHDRAQAARRARRLQDMYESVIPLARGVGVERAPPVQGPSREQVHQAHEDFLRAASTVLGVAVSQMTLTQARGRLVDMAAQERQRDHALDRHAVAAGDAAVHMWRVQREHVVLLKHYADVKHVLGLPEPRFDDDGKRVNTKRAIKTLLKEGVPPWAPRNAAQQQARALLSDADLAHYATHTVEQLVDEAMWFTASPEKRRARVERMASAWSGDQKRQQSVDVGVSSSDEHMVRVVARAVISSRLMRALDRIDDGVEASVVLDTRDPLDVDESARRGMGAKRDSRAAKDQASQAAAAKRERDDGVGGLDAGKKTQPGSSSGRAESTPPPSPSAAKRRKKGEQQQTKTTRKKKKKADGATSAERRLAAAIGRQ